MFGGMPRVSTKTTEEEVKRAPRKRAVRRVVTKDDEVPAPRRTRAPRKVVAQDDTEEDVSPRRAPTVFAKEKAESSRKRKSLMVGAGVFLVVVAISAWIGSTDAGQINVTAKIEEESQRQPQANIDVENQEGVTSVPVQNTPPPPEAISGLRGRGVGTAPVEQPTTESAPETTEATSTEAVSEEVSTSETPEAETEEAAPETTQ